MARKTDHDKRDAEHAARTTIQIAVQRYVRRLNDDAYTYIAQEALDHDGDEHIDWSEIGKGAATRALSSFGFTAPQEIIDAPAERASLGDGDS